MLNTHKIIFVGTIFECNNISQEVFFINNSLPDRIKKATKKELLVTENFAGEVEATEVKTYVKTEERHFKKGEFLMEHFSLSKLLLDKKYNLPTLRVLIALKARLDFNNRIKTFTQSELAEEAKTTQAEVSRALKQLKEDSIIKSQGNSKEFYFSDEYIKGAGDRKKRKKTSFEY